MRKWKKTAAMGSILMLFLLSGCEKEVRQPWEPSRNRALDIAEDGTVTEYLTDPLDQEWYDYEELDRMVREEVAAYRSQYGPGRITVEASEWPGSGPEAEPGRTAGAEAGVGAETGSSGAEAGVGAETGSSGAGAGVGAETGSSGAEAGTLSGSAGSEVGGQSGEAGNKSGIRLVLKYRSWEDYLEFNRMKLYAGTMLGAQVAGFSFEGTFANAEKGKLSGGVFTTADIMDRMDNMVVIATAPVEIHVPGTIDFISTGGVLFSEDTAAVENVEDGSLFYVIYDD